jgi:hypothetical protein
MLFVSCVLVVLAVPAVPQSFALPFHTVAKARPVSELPPTDPG